MVDLLPCTPHHDTSRIVVRREPVGLGIAPCHYRPRQTGSNGFWKATCDSYLHWTWVSWSWPHARWILDWWGGRRCWNNRRQGMIFIGLLVQPSVKEQVEALACKQVLKNTTPSPLHGCGIVSCARWAGGLSAGARTCNKEVMVENRNDTLPQLLR